jgi:hypothetical protein
MSLVLLIILNKTLKLFEISFITSALKYFMKISY